MGNAVTPGEPPRGAAELTETELDHVTGGKPTAPPPPPRTPPPTLEVDKIALPLGPD